MSDILNDQVGTRRRYRLAGGSPSGSGLDGHVDDLAAVYALGALEPGERELVERHCRRCPDCDRLVAEERRVVSLLPLAVPPARPAPDVKVALFARIAHAQRAAAEADLPTSRVRSLPPSLTIPASGPASRSATAPEGEPAAPWLGARPESRSRLGWLTSIATVPLLIALVATGVWGLQLRDQVSQRSGQVNSLQASLANFAAQAMSYPLTPEPGVSGAQGQLLVGADRREAMLTMQLDPELGRSYRLLGVNEEGQLVPVTELKVNEEGFGTTTFPFNDYQRVEVQAEPIAGGAEAEATAPILSGNLNGSIGSDDLTSNNAVP